jgi:hypothetical protein
MKTSAAAIKNMVDVFVIGFAFRTWRRSNGDIQERIGIRVKGLARRIERFDPGGRLPSMGQHKSFTSSNATQNAFRILTELQHCHSLYGHQVEV